MPSSNGKGDIQLSVGLDTSDARKQAKQLSNQVDEALRETATSKDSKINSANVQLKKAQREVDTLRDKLQEVADTPVINPEYQKLADVFKNTSAEIDKVANTIQKNETKLASVKAKMEELSSTKILPKELDSTALRQFKNLDAEIKEVSTDYAKLQSEIDMWKSMGFSVTDRGFNDKEKQLENLGLKMQELKAAQQDLLSAPIKQSPQYQQMAQAATQLETELNASKTQLNEMNIYAANTAAIMREMEMAGQDMIPGEATEEFSRINSQLNGALDKEKVALIKQQQLANAAKQHGFSIRDVNKNLKTMISNLMKAHKQTSKLPLSMNNLNKGVKNVLKNILKWGFGIRSMFILIRKLRTALKEGFEQLIQARPNSTLARQIDELKASLAKLKASFAAAFAPIVTTIIPYIQKLVEWVSKAVSAVAQLIAAFTGAKTYTTAVKGATAATKDNTSATKKNNKAKEEQSKQLGKIDELNVLNSEKQKEDTDSGAGAGGAVFQDLPVESKFKDWIDKLKEMWKNADFTELGKILGTKLKNALDSIDWGPIKETAGKIGKSIATFINGFVEVPDLGDTLGKTLAESLNTVLALVQGFLDNFHAMSFGDFLGDIVNGFVKNTNWQGIGKAISDFVSEVIEMVAQFIMTVDWGDIIDAIAKMIAGIDWKRLGLDIVMALTALVKFVMDALFGILSGLSIIIGDIFRDLGLDSVAGFFEGLAETFKECRTVIRDIFQQVIDWIKDFLGIHSPSTVFAQIGKYVVEGFINGIKGTIGYVIDIFKNAWNTITTNTMNAFNTIRDAIVSKITVIKDSIYTILNNLKTNWTNVWTAMKNAVVNIFNGLWSSIRSIINSILSGIQALANGVVSGINAVIRTLNNFRIQIPDWIPNYGGRSVGFSIPTISSVSIPRLATGGVIPPSASEHLAVLGDNNKETEVVSPLSTMKQAMLEALREANIGNNSNSSDQGDIVIEIDGREVFRAVRNQNQIYTKSTGKSAFA